MMMVMGWCWDSEMMIMVMIWVQEMSHRAMVVITGLVMRGEVMTR